MKVVVVILMISYACRPNSSPEATLAATEPLAATVKSAPMDFERDIQPILQSHCTPCHFKGGKMYERMPFDQSKTLVTFQEGILRRMKNDEEAAKIREFLAALK